MTYRRDKDRRVKWTQHGYLNQELPRRGGPMSTEPVNTGKTCKWCRQSVYRIYFGDSVTPDYSCGC